MHGSIMLNKHLRHPMRQGRGGWKCMLLPGSEQGAEGSGVCCCSANTSAGSIHGPFLVVLHEAQFGRYSSFPISSIKQLTAFLYATGLTFLSLLLLLTDLGEEQDGSTQGQQNPPPASGSAQQDAGPENQSLLTGGRSGCRLPVLRGVCSHSPQSLARLLHGSPAA